MQINRVILQTSVLKELTAFYNKEMELPVEIKNENETIIKIGSTELVFKQAGTADPFYHIAINIPANKIEEAKAWLSGRVELIWMDEYKSDIADFASWHAKSVYFFDPAGNIVELIARFDLDNKTAEACSSTQFLSVSEAGLVLEKDGFDISVCSLMEQYQLLILTNSRHSIISERLVMTKVCLSSFRKIEIGFRRIYPPEFFR